MTQPADTVTKFFRVRHLGTGLLTAGLSTTEGVAFVSLGFKHEPGGSPAAYALNSTYTDLTGGYYAWTFDKPDAACHNAQSIAPVSSTYGIEILAFSGETESYDRDALAALLAQPAGGAGTTFAFGSLVTLELVVYREREVAQAFSGVDLSTAAFTNWRMGIRSLDQTTTIWECDNGKLDGFSISGDASGNLSITIPESLIGPLSTTWATSRAYALGDYVRPSVNNGFVYQVTTAGTSHAATEPTWPTTEGDTVTDGTVTWTCRKKSIWVASAVRTVGDMVRPTAANPTLIYRCTVAGTSHGATEPTWPTTEGDTVTDGTVTWQCLSDPFAALGDGDEGLTLYYEVTADKLSTAKTRSIIPSSPLNLKRREYGA